ncbi:MAG: topoisomerase IV [Clostridiales bacterium]|jgi:DNA gyrase subunit A|nr:topoisomerase IV [Clostridiales bacterium]
MKEKFEEQHITETLEKNFMPYAMSVIVSRAIPEIDGFKPSHRKLLYTMYKMGLLTGPRTKSANVVGQTMKLNPHGDIPIYETMVRLTRGNGALLHPYVDSKGNFGKQYSRDMAYAASRYTEVKLEKLCEEIFKDLDKNTVDFMDNYDGTMKEPVLLPTTFPAVLVNANQGIAVGMASNICSFNLREVCRAAIAYIDDPETDLLKYITAPDFSTGGQVIYKKKDMTDLIETGRASIKARAKYRFDKKTGCIEIYEIPYTTTSEAIIDSIVELVKNNKIKDITDLRDETDLKGLKITLDIRKNVDPDALMNKLYTLTPLEEAFACNFNILIDGYPKVMGVRSIMGEWLIFRVGCVKRQLAYDIEQKNGRLHLLEGLEKILLDIDKAIKIVRETEADDLVIPNLMWGFGIDELQAEFIAEIKLRNLNKEYILNKTSEMDALKKELDDLNQTLNSDIRIYSLIKKQLEEIAKKYGRDRLSDVIHEDDVVTVTHDEMIEDYNLKLFLTTHSYFKKIPITALRNSPEQKLKDDDELCQELEWHNKSEILFFSDKQNVYKMRIYELPEHKAGSLGEYLPNLLQMEPDEKIIFFTATDSYSGFLLVAFENGKAAKIEMEAYSTKTNRKKLINAYSDLSPVVGIMHLSEDIDIVLMSSINKLLVANTSLIAPKTTKNTQGVQVMKEKKGSHVVLLKKLSDMKLEDPKYYYAKSIPAVGSYMKNEDKFVEQLSLLE